MSEFDIGLDLGLAGAEVSSDAFLQETLDFSDYGNTVMTAEDIIPDEGLYLGLDISKTSTGVTILRDGELTWFRFALEIEDDGLHTEALYRRALRSEFEKRFSGEEFDVIVVEDVFIGEFASSARILFALNTVIDDLILEGVIGCKTFIRSQSREWKKWLKLSDVTDSVRGVNDKALVSELLKCLGIVAEGKGAQDKLDSAGMLLGYLLSQMDIKTSQKMETKSVRNLRSSEICWSYEPNKDELEYPSDLGVVKFMRRVSMKSISEALTNNPSTVFVTPKVVHLGSLGEKLGCPAYPFGGYLAFWRKQ